MIAGSDAWHPDLVRITLSMRAKQDVQGENTRRDHRGTAEHVGNQRNTLTWSEK